jgi:hypothetical protein
MADLRGFMCNRGDRLSWVSWRWSIARWDYIHRELSPAGACGTFAFDMA